jgi:hypothetical protein
MPILPDATPCSPLRRGRPGRAGRLAALLLLSAVLGTAAGEARADEYDPSRAGHPLRIAAYLLHPIGVILDYAIFRPAHWAVHHEPLTTLFGHRED